MKYSKRFMAVLLSSVILAGCSDSGENTIGYIGETPVSSTEFESYLKFKRIPLDNEALKERELGAYLKRAALASAIEQESLLEQSAIDAEVAEFKKQMLVSRYFEQYLKENVTEDAVHNFYVSNPDEFQSKKARVAHILIRTNESMSQNEKQALLTKAQEIYSRIQAQEDFAKVAEETSEDLNSQKRSGEIGWLREGAIDPAFSARVFTMQQGDISEPVATPFGFHIIKILDEAQIVKTPFEQVKGDIRYRLRQQSRDAEIARLQEKVSIKKEG